MNEIRERLALLREAMAEKGFDAYIIPGTDPHASEYMAAHWKEITWISGFQGETGTVLVLKDAAYLWTDSRYYLQANKELAGSTIELMKESEIDTPTIPQFLCQTLQAGQTVGVNGEMFSVHQFADWKAQLSDKQLRIGTFDLVRPLWTLNRPAIPQTPLYGYDEQFAGQSAKAKLALIRSKMQEAGARCFVISALDEIAWLLNIRGKDVEYNPVVISYAVVEEKRCRLFVEPQKVDAAAAAYLQAQNIETAPYESIYTALQNLHEPVLFDGNRLNEALLEAMPMEVKKIDLPSPILKIKACKNAVEIAGEKAAMRKDAVALTRFFRWLEQIPLDGSLTEWDLMEKLHAFRSEQTHFTDESFCTIAGWQGNGAIVHYQADAEHAAKIEGSGVLLLDSGAQYLEGTTDITRTTWLGTIPTQGEALRHFQQAKRDYTLVLKGHIDLACAHFPRGTRGNQLDVLAHQYLWNEGLHYGHGTGHGVGHFLGCHEGPQNIRTDNNPTPLEVDMICSDEPGLYRTDQHGIRIENLIETVPDITTEFASFLRFEVLTLCFYDTRLLDVSLLSEAQLDWFNRYHATVAEQICPLLETQEEREWLQNKCKAIRK